jgi:cysteine synthase A
MAVEGILDAIGNTPLVRLTKVFDDLRFQLFAKLEALNPGGSMKDRPALRMLFEGLASGEISRDTVVIESSSGNLGIGLAQACSYLGLRFICVVDPKTTPQNLRLLEAYGAELDRVTEPGAKSGEFLEARLNRVGELLASTRNGFWPNQYANINNARAHHATAREIVTALEGKVDVLFCATGTCGTLRGCAEYLRQQARPTRIIAVDAVGSVIFGGPPAKRLLPGHGAAVRPGLFGADLADQVIRVTDLDCVIGCRLLARREAILAGASSGGGDHGRRPRAAGHLGRRRLCGDSRGSGRALPGHGLLGRVGRVAFRRGLSPMAGTCGPRDAAPSGGPPCVTADF